MPMCMATLIGRIMQGLGSLITRLDGSAECRFGGTGFSPTGRTPINFLSCQFLNPMDFEVLKVRSKSALPVQHAAQH